MLYENLPAKTYSTIVVDPAWQISLAGKLNREKYNRNGRRLDELPYKTLTLDEIKSFPLGSLAAPGCHVYLWATNKTLASAFTVLDAWGVRFHLALVLVKKSGIVPCNGYVFGSEFCLLGFYGRPMLPFTGIGKLNWLITNPTAGKHSAKPDAFYDLVSAMSPGPRLDCFARRTRQGWNAWGDEL